MAATWTQALDIPAARTLAAADSWRDYIFVVGGTGQAVAPFTSWSTTVLRGRVMGYSGLIDSWQTCTAQLPVSGQGAAMCITNTGFMYVIGGVQVVAAPTATIVESSKNVLLGKIEPGGDIRSFSVVSSLPVGVREAGLIQVKDFLYLVGGFQTAVTLTFAGQTVNFANGDVVTGGTSLATLTVVSNTDAGATGTLVGTKMTGGPFQNAETLAGVPSGGNGTANGTATLAGSTQNLNIYRARIAADGGLGAWQLIGQVPSGVHRPLESLIQINNRGLGMLVDSVLYVAKISGDGQLYPWVSLSSPAATLAFHSMTNLQDDDLVIIGGYTGAASAAKVWHARMDDDLNLIGMTPWTETESLPTPLSSHALAVVKDRVFVIGGDDATTAKATVYTAQINVSGRIGGI